ncbi:spermatogenesis-associated protein 20 isoform X2 [Chrysoperla carnea]|nr:spermatogenesis-associated protein 20 isoform X2 [Chrysoperla carnea]
MSSTSKDSTTSTTAVTHEGKTNRLAFEHSPYLRQHMYNPVDWYPWSEEAFEKARRENKLIFLSVGYSTCHWCHVMEKESFENSSVAAIMNEHFVNIKVDREERPDIDKIYMTFIQATTFRGGWPMSVFLTPDLKPITGGTYFPPEDSRYHLGFKTLLNKVATTWREKPDVLQKTGNSVLESLRNTVENESVSSDASKMKVPTLDVAKKGFSQYASNYEHEFGGWNEQPKFPQPSNFNFLFHIHIRHKDSEIGQTALEMCTYTLKKMAKGGIYDHIGDGFARYSTDSKWHVPHFEKMLYDQGQLVVSYCDAYLVTKNEFYANVAKNTLAYVSRDLSHKEGGFYSAEDADSLPNTNAKEKVEGAFYVWEYSEIIELLRDKKIDNLSYAEIFCSHYNVKKEGNVDKRQDPHGELRNKNVLIVFGSVEKTADKFKISSETVEKILSECKDILYKERSKRPRPHLDTKIITAWNGLMITGYAKAGLVLKEQNYIDRAIRAANFIKKYLYDENSNILSRSIYVGSEQQIVQIAKPIQGFLEDYAFLIRGLLDLYEASLDDKWIQWAEQLEEKQDALFWDSDKGGYYQSPIGSSNVILRLKEDQDGAEPNGNSVAVQNLLRLSAYLNRNDFQVKAGKILSAFAERLEKIPISLPEMASALISYHKHPTQVFIAGATDDPKTHALLDVVRERLLPNRLLAVSDSSGGSTTLLQRRLEVLSRLKQLNGRPAAYVCRHYACSLPVTEPTDLAHLLDDEDN